MAPSYDRYMKSVLIQQEEEGGPPAKLYSS